MASMDDVLPDHIIDHISSLLSYKQATKASALSKSWLDRWKTRPTTNLIFDFYNFFCKGLEERRWDKERIKSRNKEFTKQVTRTLTNCSREDIGINDFTLNLQWSVYGWDHAFVERCLKVAVERGVKKLHLVLPHLQHIDLPEIFFQGRKSLVDVRLGYVKFVKRSTNLEIERFDRLKCLTLECVYLTEEMFRHMIFCCQSLEILTIIDCKERTGDEITRNFEVAGLKNLELLNVRFHDTQKRTLVLGEAPSLTSLICNNVDLVRTCGCNSNSSLYPNLKLLELSEVGNITDQFFINFAYKFPCLERLSIRRCKLLQRIEISSDSLKDMELEDVCGLKSAQFNVPSIVKFDYNSKLMMVIPQISFAAIASGHQWVSHIRLYSLKHLDTSWFFKLKEFLASLIHSRVSLCLCVVPFSSFNEITSRSNDIMCLEPLEIQDLQLSYWVRPASSLLSLLDTIFCICHPKIIKGMLHFGLNNNIECLEIMYKTLMFDKDIQEQDRNSLKQIKFWQTDLRKVRVVISDSRCLDSGEELPEALSWEEFSNELETHAAKRSVMIVFKLDWRSSRTLHRAKRIKEDQD